MRTVSSIVLFNPGAGATPNWHEIGGSGLGAGTGIQGVSTNGVHFNSNPVPITAFFGIHATANAEL